MPLEITEMLDALDSAIETTVWWKPNAPALELTSREVLGQRGTLVDPHIGWLGRHGNRRPSAVLDDANFEPSTAPAQEPGPPTFSFTRSQCKKMRRYIHRAARADAKQR